MKKQYDNEMRLEFLSKSCNESFARITVAAFVAQLDPTIEEISDIKTSVSEIVTNSIIHAYDSNDEIIKIHSYIIDNCVIIEISDTGKGIDDKDLPFIWDKYYHSNKKHRRNIIGTGIGLSIVKNILISHNYNYGVKSKKNKGSNFYFEIPKNN